MKDDGVGEEEVLSLLEAARREDVAYHRVFSAMCTVPHPIAVQAHLKFIETNLGDPGLFPGTRKLEREFMKLLASLLGLGGGGAGQVTTGGTESNLQAIRAARNLARRRGGNIVVPASAHFSFNKIGDILGVQIRRAGLDSEYRVDLGEVERLVDRDTIALVGIAGTTEAGQVDPIPGLAEIAEEHGIPLHVDAAFGGFVLPFLEKKYPFDFRIPGVTSLTADPHKMGLATIPAGGLLFRHQEHMETLGTATPYLTTREQYSLTGTRSGAAAAAAYAVLIHLGKNGYRNIVRRCMEMTQQLVKKARGIGVEPCIEPVMNVVVLDIPHAARIREKLLEQGWFTSLSFHPPGLRLVVMPHTTPESIEGLVEALQTVKSKL